MAERFVIHFFSSCGIVLCTFFLLRLLRRKTSLVFLPSIPEQQLLFSALAVFAVSTLREAYDVYRGQPLLKAFTDYASWLFGCGFSVFGLYRLSREI
jgi:hypothetical protein